MLPFAVGQNDCLLQLHTRGGRIVWHYTLSVTTSVDVIVAEHDDCARAIANHMTRNEQGGEPQLSQV